MGGGKRRGLGHPCGTGSHTSHGDIEDPTSGRPRHHVTRVSGVGRGRTLRAEAVCGGDQRDCECERSKAAEMQGRHGPERQRVGGVPRRPGTDVAQERRPARGRRRAVAAWCAGLRLRRRRVGNLDDRRRRAARVRGRGELRETDVPVRSRSRERHRDGARSQGVTAVGPGRRVAGRGCVVRCRRGAGVHRVFRHPLVGHRAGCRHGRTSAVRVRRAREVAANHGEVTKGERGDGAEELAGEHKGTLAARRAGGYHSPGARPSASFRW